MTLTRTHALTAPELALLRTRKPAARTDLFLAIWPMFRGAKGDPFNAIVWTGRVNEPGAIVDDRLYEIDYDGGSGAPDFALTLPDMTVYVGTVAGADDVGRARLRGWDAGATGVAGTMLLGEMSQIEWVDDLYLTVIDDFNLWPRHLYIDDAGVIYMDHGYYDEVAAANVDGAYTDQHAYPDPTPVLGPDAVGWLPSAGNYRVYFDASNSFTLDGGALTYAWAFPGSVANGGLAVAATWAEYDSADSYRADCAVSRNYAPVATFTGHRRIWVFDEDNMPTVKFELQNCAGDYGAGGWSYSVQMWDEARLSEIVDRARCVLFARDWFDGVEQSVGPLTTDQFGGMTLRANVVCNGWIAGESINWDNEKGSVTFDVQGPKFWLDQMVGFPHGVENSDGVPADWFQFQDLTVRDGLWSFLHWRSTATRMMDIELTDDTREIAVFSTPIGSLWAQLVAGAYPAILAPPVCDRYGTLIVEIPINHEFAAGRVGVPTVLAMTVSDWREQIDLARRTVSPRSMTDLSGVHYTDSTTAAAFFALSYGHIFGRYGKIGRQERLALFAVQATNNSLCGLVQAAAAMEYPTVDYRLAGNYRVCDIVPRQRISQSIAAADTERGIEWTDKLLLPRSVSFAHSEGALLADMTCEEETGEAVSTDGEAPVKTPSPPIDPVDPPNLPVEPEPTVSNGVAIICQDQIAISFDFFDGVPTWYDFDPLGDLVGVFQNVAVTADGQAYVTTRHDKNEANTGLWHCASIAAATTGTNTWALIKSATAAAGDTGYVAGSALDKCCFGAVYVNGANQVCALVHSEGNRVPVAPGSGAYIGTGAVVAISLFGGVPAMGGNYFFQEQPANTCIHAVFGGAGSWYIAGKAWQAPNNKGVLAVGPAWVFTDFFAGPGEARLATANGDSGGYVVGQSDQVYSGWAPGAPMVGLTIARAVGIFEDFAGAHYVYDEDDGLYDLYQDGGVAPIGDATSAVTGFGANAFGSNATFEPTSSLGIVWVVGEVSGGGVPFATHRVVIYSADGGLTWADKTSNLQAALGIPASWNGWTDAATANSINRTFVF